MKKKVTVYLPDELCVACIANGIKPRRLLQHFAEQVRLWPKNLQRESAASIATDYLIKFVSCWNMPKKQNYNDEQYAFIDEMDFEFAVLLRQISGVTIPEREKALNHFFKEWLDNWELLNTTYD